MKRYTAGQILLMSVPFTSFAEGKRRPVLVVADTGDEDIVVARVTSQSGKSAFDVVVVDWHQAGTFVSLHRRGQLRGCIGTFGPTQENVAEEIIHNSISSATQDPRFTPVEPRELADLEINVDVLSTPEPVSDLEELDPKRDGIIVSAGRRLGLLLPDLDGVDTVAQQIDICRHKAGIGPNEPVQLQRFTVERYR